LPSKGISENLGCGRLARLRSLYVAILIMAFLAFVAEMSQAAEFCVSTVEELKDALTYWIY
jgi:hypothetical protein